MSEERCGLRNEFHRVMPLDTLGDAQDAARHFEALWREAQEENRVLERALAKAAQGHRAWVAPLRSAAGFCEEARMEIAAEDAAEKGKEQIDEFNHD